MGEQTSISYVHKTWSPWIGCTKVSPGCKNCYAETLDKRFHYTSNGWGKGKPRHRTSEAYWKKPLKWNEEAKRLDVRYRVFPSLCDPFDEWVSLEWFNDFSALMINTLSLDWLLLTKRPENIIDEFINRYPNVHLGISVENQEYYEHRMNEIIDNGHGIEKLFLSIEPMLGSIDLTYFPLWFNIVNWVIVGGESGPNRRPFEVEWAIDIYNQCKAAGIPFFMKQDSALKPGQQGRIPDWLWKIKQIPE